MGKRSVLLLLLLLLLLLFFFFQFTSKEGME